MKFIKFANSSQWNYAFNMDKIEKLTYGGSSGKVIVIHLDSGANHTITFESTEDAEAAYKVLGRQLGVLTVTMEDGNVNISTVDNL